MSELLLYGDSVKLEYHDGAHKYLVSKLVKDDLWTAPAPVTGVSTYCNSLSKDFMGPWAAKLAAEYIAENWGTTTKAKLIDAAKKRFRAVSNVGKRAGKLGHLYVEARLKGKDIVMPTADADLKVIESVARAFDKFTEDWQPDMLEIEKVLYSKSHNYAGTADFIAEIDGKLVIGDWKTSNTSRYNPDGIYETYFMQLGGYCIAYEEMTGKEVGELVVVNLPKDGSNYKLKRLEDLGMSKLDCMLYFLNVKQAYELNQRFQWALGRGGA